MSPADRLIVPLDVASLAEAITLVDQLPQVQFWKVGLELFISAGPEILALLRERQKRIFLDLKLHDIPNTVAGAVNAAITHRVDLLTVHTTGGRSALQAAVAAVADRASSLNLLGVTVLTSLDSRAIAFELKIPLELPEYVLHLALLAQDSGLPGVVCSPHEATEIRRVCGPDFILVCPGVRPAWAAAQDQRRVMTPSEAIAAGADYLVIGRPITQAANPIDAWERICAELA
ncbi:MAG: orotidine-5'-phosphate decarboxylase [Spirulina sp. SIO3F2]|nr:orotidine-5'-phosphate decarboxylase [Spirulina sp. SIO3F2]